MSSDDEPLEISDFSVAGPFEQITSKLSAFLRGAVKEFHMEAEKLHFPAAQRGGGAASTADATGEQSAVEIRNTGHYFVRDFHFAVGSSLQGLDDFESRLHGRQSLTASPTGASSSSGGGSQQQQQQRLVASLYILRADGVATAAAAYCEQQERQRQRRQHTAESSGGSGGYATATTPDVHNRHPVVGLCGLPAFLYLRPHDRTPHLAPTMSSTLLSLGLNALDETGPSSLLNVMVVAPGDSKHALTFRGMGKVRFGGESTTKRSSDGSNLMHLPAAVMNVLATAFLYRTNDNLSNLIPLILPERPRGNGGGGIFAQVPRAAEASADQREHVAALDVSSRAVSLKDRAFAGLGFLDGIVDAFVQSCGNQSRFVSVTAAEVGMIASAAVSAAAAAAAADSSSGKGGKSGKKWFGSSSSASASSPAVASKSGSGGGQLEGTVWADASRVYRAPVPPRARWVSAVLPSWDSRPNGHDRAMAGLMLGFDSDASSTASQDSKEAATADAAAAAVAWTQLAGMPSLPIGTTENPLETFSVETAWSFLRVDATSVTDNEGASWFDDVMQGSFARAGSGGSPATPTSGGTGAKRGMFGFSSRSSALPAGGGFAGAASSAAAAALGPPTSVALAAHLRHRAEFSSRVRPAFEQFVREAAAKVLAPPLDDARRRFLVQQSANRAASSAAAVRAAFLRRGRDVINRVCTPKSAAGPPASTSSGATAAAADPNEGGVRSTVRSWFGALLSAGTTAVSAVTHSALDALQGAHPEELIVPRRTMLAAHVNNILAASRTPDSGGDSFVVSLPRTTSGAAASSRARANAVFGLPSQPRKQKRRPAAAAGNSMPLFGCASALSPGDIRRHVPPGTVLSRFAVECRHLKHADELRALFIALLDVLREILTGTRAKELDEEYHFVSALRLARAPSTTATTSGNRAAGGADPPPSGADVEREQQEHRINTFLAALLVDVEVDDVEGFDDCDSDTDGAPLRALQVDPCADIVHQKFQALAICAMAMRRRRKPKRRQQGDHAVAERDGGSKSAAAAAAPAMVPSAKRLAASKKAGKSNAKAAATAASDADSRPEDFVVVPQTAQRFTAPLTFGDRNTTAAAGDDAQTQSTTGKKSTGGGTDMLFRDMLAFLAANRARRGTGGVSLADFLAWFSPNDVADYLVVEGASAAAGSEFVTAQVVRAEEQHAAQSGSLPLGYEFLSLRMRQRGNAWREAWLAASKVSAANNSAASADKGKPTGTDADGDDANCAEALEAAMDIFEWLKQRPAHEIVYVVLKAQAAAAAAQMVQHPVFAALDAPSSGTEHLRNALQRSAGRTAVLLSDSFPTWEDFEEGLAVEVEGDDDQASKKAGAAVGGYDDDDLVDATDGSLNAETPSPQRASSPSSSPTSPPVLDTLAPELAHKMQQLFAPHALEMEKAEYQLCIAVAACDAVAPFGSGADTPALLQTAQRIALAVFDFVAHTDARFSPSPSSSAAVVASGSSNTSSSQQHELPVDWESAIFTADQTGRIAPPIYVDSALFMRAMCPSWLAQSRGVDGPSSGFASSNASASANSSSDIHNKIRKVLTKRYRVYGYTQRVAPSRSADGADSGIQQLLPPSFQRVVAQVDCAMRSVLVVSTTSKVV